MSAMLATDRRAERLALLVGSNPLPNYLAAVVLEPREVFLLHSPETREPCERLEAALQERQIAVYNVAVEDATDARKIHDACASLQVDHLHYSGGTKPMAAHARKACSVDEARASYLDERRGLLRFDDGYDLNLEQRDLGLTLDRVLKLHGIERVAPSAPVPGAPTDGDVTALAERIFREPGVASKLFDLFRPEDRRRSFTQAKSAPWTPGDHNLSLSAPRVPDAEWNKARYEAWDKLLTGGWLEPWTASLIRASLGEAASVIEVGVMCKRVQPSPADFEIDVALIRGHRLHVISCTTDQKKPLCKPKLFEVSMRARQMGGDLARSALVCLLDGSDARGSYVDQLRADIASLWDAPNVPRVFGLADLREWAGTSGSPNLGSLKEWLDS
jgi:hypothetical protein